MDGMIGIHEAERLLGRKDMRGDEDFETLAGFVLARFGQIPQTGDHFAWDGLRFEIVDMDGRRIDRILVAPEPSRLAQTRRSSWTESAAGASQPLPMSRLGLDGRSRILLACRPLRETRLETELQPNFLIVMVDQLAGTFFPDGPAAFLHAPDARRGWPSESVRFNANYCASPLCAPSRAAFMTGQLPSRTGVYDNAAEFPSSIPTFAHHLRRLGYRTALCGKMHFVGPDQLHGFEERLTTDIYPADFGWTPDWTQARRAHRLVVPQPRLRHRSRRGGDDQPARI